MIDAENLFYFCSINLKIQTAMSNSINNPFIGVRKIAAQAVALILLLAMSFSCEKTVKSSEREIIAIMFDGLIEARIDVFYDISPDLIERGHETVTHVGLTVCPDVDLMTLAPRFVLSPGATISPPSGTVRSFHHQAASYVITAEDGTTSFVTMHVAPPLEEFAVRSSMNSANELISFTVEGLIESEINVFDTKVPDFEGGYHESFAVVSLLVSPDVDITSLAPHIVLSPGATITPAIGVAQNFTEQVNYVITAKDGTTSLVMVLVSPLFEEMAMHSNLETRASTTVNISSIGRGGTFPSGRISHDTRNRLHITSYPDSHHRLYAWLVNGAQRSTNVVFNDTVSVNANITAIFMPYSGFLVTVESEDTDRGTVSATSGNNSGSTIPVVAGQIVTLSARPATGHTFAGWYRNGTTRVANLGATATYTPTGNVRFVARFNVPPPVISGHTSVCPGVTNATFTLQNIPPSATVRWIADAPLSKVSSNQTFVTVRHTGATMPASSRIRAEILKNGQVVNTVQHDVVVNRPVIHSIQGPSVVSTGSSFFSIDHSEGTFTWSVTPSHGVHFLPTGGNFIPISFVFPGTYTITVSASNDCGTAIVSKSVTVLAPGPPVFPCLHCGTPSNMPRGCDMCPIPSLRNEPIEEAER